jgi:hypothetical protein
MSDEIDLPYSLTGQTVHQYGELDPIQFVVQPHQATYQARKTRRC